ncbi:hypothetical protein TSAR_008157 [Trichomalopsis sarcophagae]|uniref:Uncharacterized protein n=1 Tax=Trichomalopsis sarcophagae TaxID=543379 RepID=A0A232F7Y2_9HYME|nr:hypothetical protein TSAR_008157 [Trichomalopsis sarcophagae]
MSPLDDIKSTTSVESELMVSDMLEEHEHHHHSIGLGAGKRKRQDDNDGDDLGPRKLPSLASNNNDVSFVLEEHNAEDGLHDDRDDVSFGEKYRQ